MARKSATKRAQSNRTHAPATPIAASGSNVRECSRCLTAVTIPEGGPYPFPCPSCTAPIHAPTDA